MIRELYTNKSGPVAMPAFRLREQSAWNHSTLREQDRTARALEEELTIAQLLEAKRRRIEPVM